MDELPQVIEPCVKCQDRESPSEKKSAHSEGPLGPLGHVKARSATGYRVVDQFPYAIGHPSTHAQESRLAPRSGREIPGGGPVVLGARLRARAADRGKERETLDHGDQTISESRPNLRWPACWVSQIDDAFPSRRQGEAS